MHINFVPEEYFIKYLYTVQNKYFYKKYKFSIQRVHRIQITYTYVGIIQVVLCKKNIYDIGFVTSLTL